MSGLWIIGRGLRYPRTGYAVFSRRGMRTRLHRWLVGLGDQGLSKQDKKRFGTEMAHKIQVRTRFARLSSTFTLVLASVAALHAHWKFRWVSILVLALVALTGTTTTTCSAPDLFSPPAHPQSYHFLGPGPCESFEQLLLGCGVMSTLHLHDLLKDARSGCDSVAAPTMSGTVNAAAVSSTLLFIRHKRS